MDAWAQHLLPRLVSLSHRAFWTIATVLHLVVLAFGSICVWVLGMAAIEDLAWQDTLGNVAIVIWCFVVFMMAYMMLATAIHAIAMVVTQGRIALEELLPSLQRLV